MAASVSIGAASASGDAPYSLTGAITDTAGNGVAGLSLSLFDSSSALVDTEPTGVDGTYAFAGLTDGTYSLETMGSTGYVSIRSTVVVADADTVLNITDPRYGTITGIVTEGASALSGVSIRAVDSATNAGYSADGATDANGSYSITVPATTGAYAIYFSNSSGARLPIESYDFGGGVASASNACVLSASNSRVAGLASGAPVNLSVLLNPDVSPCGGATPAPSSAPPKASGHAHPSTVIAQTGSTVVPTPTPTPTPTAAETGSSRSSEATTTAPADLKPLTPTSSTAPMPAWGWLLVALAVLALLGGVGFTVVRHR